MIQDNQPNELKKINLSEWLIWENLCFILMTFKKLSNSIIHIMSATCKH